MRNLGTCIWEFLMQTDARTLMIESNQHCLLSKWPPVAAHSHSAVPEAQCWEERTKGDMHGCMKSCKVTEETCMRSCMELLKSPEEACMKS
mmetsp:Transcript_27537/g.70967  ORF Transcript_27537/g.70967 Transcript_27537/m.70967 type:complete len:91 (-) Transcript_27537:76-348(-)